MKTLNMGDGSDGTCMEIVNLDRQVAFSVNLRGPLF